MVPMNIVATNIRFPADEYQELKLLAFSQGRSVAAVIRDGIKQYKKKNLAVTNRVSLAEKLRKISVKIDVPILDLVRVGRKFE